MVWANRVKIIKSIRQVKHSLFINYPLISFFSSPPPYWGGSQLDWIISCFRANIKKFATYLSVAEKDLLIVSRKKEAKKNNTPLVTVIIPTFRRADLLISRSIPSVLNQTYKNLELIVVGDHCTDKTEDYVNEITDTRFKFVNLSERGQYPDDPLFRWMVAGVKPVNIGLKKSKGDWIAHLDDDDEFSPNHIEVLLKYALENDFEMVYGKVDRENPDGHWTVLGNTSIESGLCRSSTLYRSYLKYFFYDINSWKKLEPADLNLWMRMKRAGVRIGFLNMNVGKHYKDKTSIVNEVVSQSNAS